MKGRKIIAVCVVIVLACLALTVKPRTKPVRLADGTLIELSGLKFGTSNAFVHGNGLERILGNLLPTNGLQLGPLKLNRPKIANQYGFNRSTLSAEFRISGPPVAVGKSLLLNPKFYREYRVVITGPDGFPYVEEFLRPTLYPDGAFIYVNSTSFPRRARILHFQIQQHDQQLAPWKTLVEFEGRNPGRDEQRSWPVEMTPVQRLTNDLEFLVDRITVTPTHSNRWEYFWQTTVNIPIQVKENGVLGTNWTLHQIQAEDVSGNSLFVGVAKQPVNDWMLLQGFRSLDPGKVWRVKADLARESEFPPEELFTFEVPVPPGGSFLTNFGSDVLKVGWVNSNMLAVELPEKPEGKRLIFVGARDYRGRSIDEHSGSWSRSRFWKSLKLPERVSRGDAQSAAAGPGKADVITATVALTRNIPVEFTVQPQLNESSARP